MIRHVLYWLSTAALFAICALTLHYCQYQQRYHNDAVKPLFWSLKCWR